MKLFLNILLVVSPFLMHSQDIQVEYLDQYLEPTKKNKAMYTRQLVAEAETLTATITSMSGVLKATGSYIIHEEELVPHGYFTFFYANGQKESEGLYVKGYKSGDWKRYLKDGTERPVKYYNPKLGSLVDNLR